MGFCVLCALGTSDSIFAIGVPFLGGAIEYNMFGTIDRDIARSIDQFIGHRVAGDFTTNWDGFGVINRVRVDFLARNLGLTCGLTGMSLVGGLFNWGYIGYGNSATITWYVRTFLLYNVGGRVLDLRRGVT